MSTPPNDEGIVNHYEAHFCDDCNTVTWHDRDCTDTDCQRDHSNSDHGDCWGIPVEPDTIMCDLKNGDYIEPADRILTWANRHSSTTLGRGLELEQRTGAFAQYGKDLTGYWFVVVRTTRHVIEELPV